MDNINRFYENLEKLEFKFFKLFVNSKKPAKPWKHEKNHLTASEACNILNKKYGNIGICPAKGYSVVDVDNKKIFEKLEKVKGWNSETLVTKTPHGYHFYFKSKNLKQTQGGTSLGKGVDIREGGEGYVVGPGSVVDQKTYLIKQWKPIIEANKEFEKISIITAPKKKICGNFYTTSFKVIKKGMRDNTIYKLCRDMLDMDIKIEDIEKAISEFNSNFFEESLPPKELSVKLQSAFKHYPNYQGENRIYKENKNLLRIDLYNRLKALNYKLRFNIRTDKIEIKKDKKWITINDREEVKLLCDLEEKSITPPYPEIKNKKTIIGGLIHKKITIQDWSKYGLALAGENLQDPFKIWLKSLPPWDGVERLNFKELEKIFKITSNKTLASWAFKSVLLACVWRCFKPGTKFDEVVIFQGPESIGKSTFWRVMLKENEWFADSMDFGAYNDKERVETLLSRVLVEAAELKGTRKTSLASLKAFISKQIDQVRLSYRRNPEDFKRRFVIVGTTNDPKGLPNDPTGNRRFVVVALDNKYGTNQVKNLYDHVEKNRDQYWAEALHYYKTGKKAILEGEIKEISLNVASEFRSGDELLENALLEIINFKEGDIEENEECGFVIDKFKKKWKYFTIKHVIKKLDFDYEEVKKPTTQKIAPLLRKEGWFEKRTWIKGVQKRWWLKKIKTQN